jgi:hypothetical protein
MEKMIVLFIVAVRGGLARDEWEGLCFDSLASAAVFRRGRVRRPDRWIRYVYPMVRAHAVVERVPGALVEIIMHEGRFGSSPGPAL